MRNLKLLRKLQDVEKVKDPRRVEAGKRLGMISKQAKERKLAQVREASATEAKEKNDDWFPPTTLSRSLSIDSFGSPVVGIGFVGLVGLALYYAYVKKYKSVEEQSKASNHVKSKEVEAVSEATSKTKPKRVYKELDTLD